MKTRYDIMTDFEVPNENGDTYKDIFSYPDDTNLVSDTAPTNLVMTKIDKQRFDLTMFNIYDTTEWDDIILWYNKIFYLNEIEIGEEIIIPEKSKLFTFYQLNY